jgi:hypothetical protein
MLMALACPRTHTGTIEGMPDAMRFNQAQVPDRPAMLPLCALRLR